MEVTASLSLDDLGILLVEPSNTQRRLIQKQLTDQGIKTLEAVSTAREALMRMRVFVPDLIISSLYLPDADAHELFALMQKDSRLSEVAKMVVSSEQKRENLEAVRQAGVLALLPKPFDRTDLQRALVTTLEYLTHEEVELELYDITSLRVLLVDDSRMARNHLRRVLQQIGVEHIDEAVNGQEAIGCLQQAAYDLVVTDYNMPVMDGEALIGHIRQSADYSHLPIMMVTSEDESRLASVRQAGVSAICDKPFEVSQVRNLLISLLEPDAS
ncbi:two-component system, chemotaxis family, response regulator CheY [Marinospirillum celere]|uniref:Two-component system, chemotaxis family, response regulator CheY n=1 Tax=Marinospirillum celere TaxID=1122252 RepID=A0A1I1GM56_9GAMM|nr:response regulator [Marinospirillum celere]SFC12342.1 two-component system, chemotaxis family, response regulator CheY [Marinospirillum celere]